MATDNEFMRQLLDQVRAGRRDQSRPDHQELQPPTLPSGQDHIVERRPASNEGIDSLFSGVEGFGTPSPNAPKTPKKPGSSLALQEMDIPSSREMGQGSSGSGDILSSIFNIVKLFA